jgi:hypothetical protein
MGAGSLAFVVGRAGLAAIRPGSRRVVAGMET